MDIASSVSLKPHNTLCLDAQADWFVSVRNSEELVSALDFARERNLAVFPLGEGSNVVLRERLPGLVVHMATQGIQLRRDDGREACLRVAAGENWHDLVVWCCDRGLHGLENLALIPGSVGAAPVQNIGAYGVELSDWIQGVEVRDIQSGALGYLSASDCEFGYRTSRFKTPAGKGLLITAVDIRVDRNAEIRDGYPTLKAALKDDTPSHRQVLEAVISVRQARLPDPVVTPNVGSFFKNPIVPAETATRLLQQYPDLPSYATAGEDVKLSAAWMIDQLGWRGKAQAGVAVSRDHSLVLVNRSATSSEAVLGLADAIRRSVRDVFGLELVLEPQVLGAPDSEKQ